ncbi:hypothetical protein IMSHALPRED_006057 [Imshaugia aleurites]|uniref:Methyltransferase domain-containing protein n=1 Tax=Imshaugia aleurites TaxID=172621 RepID=A0A8H3IS60_9LECA|nr:hypothetical protein IMSHALPRED_006057 [Imshaugia aleurites]
MSSTTSQNDSRAHVDHYSKDVPWYDKEPENFSPACRELLQNYSHIPPGEVTSHVLEMVPSPEFTVNFAKLTCAQRERAWAISPYPCIGRFRFLDLSISLQPSYHRILSFLKEPQSHHTLLDLGCCFAQDVRKLVHDGVPSENLYACDLEQSFLDLSYDLFKDENTMKAHLFTTNVFAEDGPLDKLQGKMDVVYTASFLHLFGWDDQLKICKRIIKTLKPRKGSTVFGRQMGNLKGQEVPNKSVVGQDSSFIWLHDVESFTRLWDTAGRETGTKWKTWGALNDAEGMGTNHWGEKGVQGLRFEAVRVE